VKLTKFTHACIRLESGDHAVVIDPGEWSEEWALDGISAVLVTHEHFDHLDVTWLSRVAAENPALHVWAPAPVAENQLGGLGDKVTAVAPGDSFSAGGFPVRVVGGEHAEIYEGLPGCANVGYLVGEAVYHPGDALSVPDVPVDTLLVPASAPWLKLAEALDFVRAIKPRRAYPIHDAMLSVIGQQSVERWMTAKGDTDYAWLAPGDAVDL
jgi:L-ascorbate metabolism protein UlaG (beta-lactamase superfamily)